MIKFQTESIRVVEIEGSSILNDNYEELTINKQVVKLNPDWYKYQKLEQAGNLKVFTVRDSDVLIGYCIFFIDTHIHYKDLLVATNDVLYLTKAYRKGTTGIKLIKYADSTLRNIGVNKITWHIKDSLDFSPILIRIGYKKEDSLFGVVC